MLHVAATLLVAMTAHQCPERAIGPGTHVEGGTRGAVCILAAFRHGCRPAVYSLTGVGIGTIAVRSFTVQPWNGRCAVLVIATVTTGGVHGRPTVDGPRVCRLLRRTGVDVVADGCSGRKPTSFSLTSFT